MKPLKIICLTTPLLTLPISLTGLADAGNITLYGQARLSIDVTDNGSDSATRVSNGESRLGIKGVEELGNDLKAVFQIEVNANLDDGAGSTGSLFAAARDSYVGLAGGFGTIALGIINTPYRESTEYADVFNNSLGDYNSILGNVGDGDTIAEFNRREPNTINYWSPKWNGLNVKGQYRLDEIDGMDQNRYSIAGNYENGPWLASLAYERHNGEGGDGANDTSGAKAGLAYSFNESATKVAVVYEALNEQGADSPFDRDARYISLAHKLGNTIFKGAYAHAGDNDAADDSGADFFLVGLTHTLSKRTEVFGLYARTDNDDNGAYGLGGSTSGLVAAAFPGASYPAFPSD